MILYRYELYCEEEPQDVGFIVGLNDLIDSDVLSEMHADILMEPFDDELPFPNPKYKDVMCLFTEFGKLVFDDAIKGIITAYEGSIFNVREIIVELSDDEKDKLEYEDEYQVCLRTDLFKKLATEYERKKRFAA